VRVEDRKCSRTHAKLPALVAPASSPVWVDHVDGLADPGGYLSGCATPASGTSGWRRSWNREPLARWPVEGTTGYEFRSTPTLFVDPAGRDADAATGPHPGFAAVAIEAKAEQVRVMFSPEVRRLRRLADLAHLEAALAALPVYRTYVDPETRECSTDDACALARLPDDVADAIRHRDRAPPVRRGSSRRWARSWPRVSRTPRCTVRYSRQQVGGDPDRFGPSSTSSTSRRAPASDWPRRWPRPRTTRSGARRVRIGALAGMAADWRRSSPQRPLRRALAGGPRRRGNSSCSRRSWRVADRRRLDGYW
jgi:hypothetical protein